jgi:hypothetical protein
MEVADTEPALQERLGAEGTAALVHLFNVARQEWAADVTTTAVERFERRLLEEVGTLRADIRNIEGNLRLDLTREFAALRQEIAGIRREIGTSRFELLKWSFAFWLGQIIAVATVVRLMLQMASP